MMSIAKVQSDNHSPKILFDVADPRGVRVRCYEYQWETHVIQKRPWMDDLLDEVIRAIESPTMGIYSDSDRENREIYYKINDDKPKYMKVVIEHNSDENIVKFITAFPTDSPKSGEKLIWINQKN